MAQQASTVKGIVRAIEGLEAVVEIEHGGCGRCHEEGGCGGQQLTQMFCAGPKSYRLANPGGARVGETVTVAIAAGTVRRSANLAYGVPLLGLIAGATVGMHIGGDAGAMGGGGVGLVLAWFLALGWMRRGSGKNAVRPYIVSR